MLARHGEIALYGGVSSSGTRRGLRGHEDFCGEDSWLLREGAALAVLMGLAGSVVWSAGGEGSKTRGGSREEVTSFVRQTVVLYAWKGVSFPQ